MCLLVYMESLSLGELISLSSVSEDNRHSSGSSPFDQMKMMIKNQTLGTDDIRFFNKNTLYKYTLVIFFFV